MTAVTDASVVVAYLLGEAGAAERQALAGGPHAPAFLDVEVTHVLRGLVRAGKLDAQRAGTAREELRDLGVIRHPDHVLLEGAWRLRDRCTTYDGLYVALAQALDGTFYTRDAKLARGVDGLVPMELPPG